MKKLLLGYIVFSWLFAPVFAYTVDDSIDSDIKNTYKTQQIEKDLLPALPSVSPSTTYGPDAGIFGAEYKPTSSSPQKSISTSPQVNSNYVNKNTQTTPYPLHAQNETGKIPQQYQREYKEIKLKKGTKFKIRIRESISSATPRGTRVTFVSTYPATNRYITIPHGTLFKGEITNSHDPQLFGNGGLIELKIDELVYKNSAYYINSKVSLANYRRIYLNNIKGKQTYIKSMRVASKPGKKFMKKMFQTTGKLHDGPEMILIPVAVVSGVTVYGVNLALSPVFALFASGSEIRLPSGTYFEIKLTEDALIREY